VDDVRDVRIGTWEETEAAVGTVIAYLEGVDPVSESGIRRRLEVFGWDAPIHYSDAAARAAGYDGIVSPATMVITWVLPPYWSPGDPRPQLSDPYLLPRFALRQIPAPGDALFGTGCKTKYLQPAYVGDRISGEVVFAGYTRKRLKIGDGAFMVARTRYSNQREEVIALEEITVFRYTPRVTDVEEATE
jgi:3-methylfumaryl-CoA hydratase